MKDSVRVFAVVLSCLFLFACDAEMESVPEGPVDLRTQTSPPPVPDELKQITFTKSEKSNAYVFTDSEKGQSSISYELRNGEYYYTVKSRGNTYQMMVSPHLRAFLTVENGVLVSATVDGEEVLPSQATKSTDLRRWLAVVIASFMHQVGVEPPGPEWSQQKHE